MVDRRNSQTRRRPTFSNIVPMESHGNKPLLRPPRSQDEDEDAIEEDEGGPSTQPGASYRRGSLSRRNGFQNRYVQIAGDAPTHEVDEDAEYHNSSGRYHARHGSASSVDTADLMDHRNMSSDFGNTPLLRRVTTANTGSGVRSSGVSPLQRRLYEQHQNNYTDNNGNGQRREARGHFDQQQGASHDWAFSNARHRSGHDSPRSPLLSQPGHTSYDAFTDPINGADSFAIAMEDPNLDTSNIHSPGSLTNMPRFIDIDSSVQGSEDEEEIPKSNPSSRRSSSGSSLNDVCFPIDTPLEIDPGRGAGKVWPDLNVLEEFANEELNENQEAERQQAMVDDITGERTYEQNTGTNGNGHPLMQDQLDGRLRPHRIIPWSMRKKNSPRGLSESPFTGLPQFDEKNPTQFRFTYFREDMDATIHSPNISGLLRPGQNFADLFPPRISADEDFGYADLPIPQDAAMESGQSHGIPARGLTPVGGVRASRQNTSGTEGSSSPKRASISEAAKHGGTSTPGASRTYHSASQSPKPMDPAPFWLNIMNPTEEEMKVLSKTFGIHPLTTEDIFLGETREKVELFRNYYLVCFRSIDLNHEKVKSREKERERKREKLQKLSGNRRGSNSVRSRGGIFSMFRRRKSEGEYQSLNTSTRKRRGSKQQQQQQPQSGDKGYRSSTKARRSELKPLNMYIIVFHEGVLTFHFSPTTHPINVRRRARLLRDYITVSSDWISYALIDDITDGFAPMIEAIEDEVNEIEEEIMRMNSGEISSDESSDEEEEDAASSKSSNSDSSSSASGSQVWRERGDMLRRIGDTRKRVMSLLRLLGSKADVIKGFSKRCNEQWEVAPRSEIGLYLGDIQDHIVTMVQSLNHYEKLLARSHSNYLAQINIDMTRVNNDMNDVLGKITVLGTIVLPMNIVTGLWGMNVFVPGQEQDGLTWFWSITLSLFLFGCLGWIFMRKIWKM